MSSLMETLAGQLGGNSLGQISRQLGADQASTTKAISGALPMLFGALAKNSTQSHGASALSAALDRDHDGSVLDDLAGFMGNSQAQAKQGGGILGHLLGARQGAVQSSLSRSSGLSQDGTGKLLMMLAPMVMGALGKAKRQQGLDSSGLASMLQREQEQVTKAQPQMGMLGNLLDRDGDGEVFDDIAKAGAGLLGRFLK